MAAKRHERTSARRAALQVMYTSEITDESPAAIAEGDRRLEEDGPLPEYALMLVRGVESHRIAIDNHLAATSENWSLARMPIVDRSILRLATFEMMYIDDVPTSVTINEAVELAKDFGGEDESHRFVNGILGRIAKMLEGEEGQEADAPSSCDADAAGNEEPLAMRENEIAEPESEPLAAPSGAGLPRLGRLPGGHRRAHEPSGAAPAEEIVDAVSSDELELDAALALYEEAVGLGLRASDLLEENIEAQQGVEEAGERSAESSDEASAQETGAPVSA